MIIVWKFPIPQETVRTYTCYWSTKVTDSITFIDIIWKTEFETILGQNFAWEIRFLIIIWNLTTILKTLYNLKKKIISLA